MTFKGFCIFTAGMLAGGAAGWFASKYYYDKKAQEVVATGADISEELKIEKRTLNEDEESPYKNEKLTHEDILDESEITASSLQSLYSEKLNTVNYGKPQEFSESVEEPMLHVSSKAQEPYIISELQWAESNGYDKVELVYYETDEVLATYENGIYDYRETGQVFCENFDDDTDIVYVRNDAYSRDFEITRDPRSFNEVATGGF